MLSQVGHFYLCISARGRPILCVIQIAFYHSPQRCVGCDSQSTNSKDE